MKLVDSIARAQAGLHLLTICIPSRWVAQPVRDRTASRMSSKRKAASGLTATAGGEDGDSPAAKRRKVPVRE